MHPFVMLHKGEHRRMERFVGATAEGDIAAARAMLAASMAERAALVYDGYASDEKGRRTDAILVEACERAGHGLAFAQRYAPATRRTPFRTVGAASYLGRVTSLLPPDAEWYPYRWGDGAGCRLDTTDGWAGERGSREGGSSPRNAAVQATVRRR